MAVGKSELDELCINAIRFLAVDAVDKANSGHPGAPMGAAPMAYTLWTRFLKFNPRDPEWPDRDRFILSAGHASMLLYALLHLTGFDLSLDDIKQFRQWGSITPGHPESERTHGVEVTTGPLGQGFGNAVGMAIAESWLANRYNSPGHEIINHYTYVLASDGDMEEGVGSEAASIAGTLRLGKLIVIYDDNNISIEGDTDITFRENVGARFEAYGWQVLGPIDGNDLLEVEAALDDARADEGRPSLIICKTVIGYGSPLQNTGEVHGSPLGAENTKIAKQNLGWPTEPAFLIPPDALAHMREAVDRGKQSQSDWQAKFDAYRHEFPDLAGEFELSMKGELPNGWDSGMNSLFKPDSKPIATRSASGKVLNAIAKKIPWPMGGSADLAPSTKTLIDGEKSFGPDDHAGRNMHFGVREHIMGSILNGMSRHGGIIPYGATFLIFSDYMRPPIRLAALMKSRAIYVFTHDSIGVGEDGPTHEPIEQLIGLRAVPNMTVIRPSDATETVEAWRAALLKKDRPVALILTRQNLPIIDRTKFPPASGLHKGAYILWESTTGLPDIILIATGSEIHIALEAAQKLAQTGTKVRIVSMPCWSFFDSSPRIIARACFLRLSESALQSKAAASMGWERYVGSDGAVIGMTTFGASAPAEVLMEKFGFTVENIMEKADRILRAGTVKGG